MSKVEIEQSGPVTTVVLNRPEVRNAVDQETAQELAAAFESFEADPEAAVAVLCGTGGTFCAGADLKQLAAGERLPPDGTTYSGRGPMGPTRLRLSKPVIAAVSGYAVAGGLELALWCDLRVLEEDAVLGVFCRRWGVPLIDGGTLRLPRLIGLSRALDLILTGRAVTADEAHQMGLANRVVPKGQGKEHAETLARELAAFPQQCLRCDRASAHRQFDLPFTEAMRREYEGGFQVLASEAVPGAKRFASGRGRHGSFEDL